ncbi:MAG: DJ-1/PfpI family protein [Clostridia bacterium]|nr:DJ-1/PfpI family protein [Clostridia bacterium]
MVYIVLADGFEEIEALTPVDVLRRAGIEVTTVGISGKTALGAHGIPVQCDVTADEVDSLDSAEALVFPGGMPGASNIDEFPLTDAWIASVLDGGGYVAAICASPMILGKRGYLKGKRAVCFPGFEEYLEGAEVMTGADAVRDGKFITSRCMGTAFPFALELVEALRGTDVRDKTEKAVLAL